MNGGRDEDLELGVERLDIEHRQILRRLRRVTAELTAGRQEEAQSALRALHGCLVEHWESEERWMEEVGYPGLEAHRREHAGLVDLVAAAREDAGASVARATKGVADLAHALIDHMKGEDGHLARFVGTRENLRLLAQMAPCIDEAATPPPGPLLAVRPRTRKRS